MDLSAYLARIGYSDAPRPDIETLRALHRAHVEAIAYEDLDVQLGRPVTIELAPIFDKLVTRRRGGWCYEMNGLFGWALSEIGFDVTRVAGGVKRAVTGEAAVGNHLVLLLDLGEPYVADVGFGSGAPEPFPLRAHAFSHGAFAYELQDLGDGWWRMHEGARGADLSYDFRAERGDETLLAEKCRMLQTDSASPFVQNVVVQRWFADRHAVLRGKVLKTINLSGETATRDLTSADDFIATLHSVFGLALPEAASLWPAILQRHNDLFTERSGVSH